ncbi:hypothetical protein OGH69_10940 [Flavobacterium sp. MFBS3-15]|uniref:hypothetical protein n=1 Tax=Flavobacterium sp. MFBS3-15 TaxID=2989816 RepID=UPI002236A54F|nr:hypothetical protein [Flavobacterium sp. MFBS3-15]MCW4469483.1 hypothetical protein [Flavobacterium sp. MFBS3-15]
MAKLLTNFVAVLSVLTLSNIAIAQEQTAKPENSFFKDRKLYLNDDGSNYVKLTFLAQLWLRNANYNPGTTIYGTEKSGGTDIGIRRYRVQLYGQLTDRVFAYSQFGENNFSNISDRKQGFFVHDAYGEYAIDRTRLSLGAGLSGWSGLTRFASPSAGSILGLDAPIYQQTTADATDQFLRKLSVFAKGKLGKLDYRIQMVQPMAIQESAGYDPDTAIGQNAMFSAKPPEMQYSGYFSYQFRDQESNQTPYATGTYHGKKKVFNIGAGFIYQKDAMWRLDEVVTDTVYSTMLHLAADVYYDAPMGDKGQAISLYGSFTYSDYGKNYLRNGGPMNPANGNDNPGILNGGGTAFPMFGTGEIVCLQAGYKFRDNLIGNTTLMPYASLQYANYERLNDGMAYLDAGVNWLLAGHTSKLTISYQDRPVYNTAGDKISSRGAVVAQYQVSFN